MPLRPSPDIDTILEAIRTEARARGSKGRVGAYSTETSGGTGGVASFGMPQLETKHVADFFALPLDVFIGEAYRQVLKRPPDATGIENYQRALLRGRLTRIEVLGRLRLSSEGRRHRNSIPGLELAFAIATFYRLPLAGPVAAFISRMLRLPSHLQDRSSLESTALAASAWIKR